MQHTTGSFVGLRSTRIFTQHWLPEAPPRAVIVLVHGYGEHSGRYAHVAARLVEAGCAVYALDHRGHGQSEGVPVHVAAFGDYVTDLDSYIKRVRVEHSNLPLFVYGHSMGSLITLRYALRNQDTLAGVITSGTALRLMALNAFTVPPLKVAGWLAPRLRLLPPLPLEGISRDPDVLQRYEQDPLNDSGSMRAGLVSKMHRAGKTIAAELPDLRLPVLALHGTADPLTPPAGVDILRKRGGSPDLTIKLYDGLRHEVHNEPEQETVLDDVVNWLNAHL
jgi:alpha-beta hydrolase superfamily lysophospholipase